MGLDCSHDAYSVFNRPLPKDWSHLLKPLIDGPRRKRAIGIDRKLVNPCLQKRCLMP